MIPMYLLGDGGDTKRKGHIRWGSGIFCHPDILQDYLLAEINIHQLCTVVLNTERPPPQGETCPPSRFKNQILDRFFQNKILHFFY